jgi:hypothetical protein
MVKQLLLASLLVSVAACGNDAAKSDNPQDAPASQMSSAVTAADTAAGTLVSFDSTSSKTLRLKLEKDQVFRHRLRMDTHLAQTGNDQVRQEDHIMSQQVVGVDEKGNFMVRTKYDKMEVHAKYVDLTTGEVMADNHFSSTDTASMKNPKAQQFALLINQPIDVLMDDRANVVEIRGGDKLANDLYNSTPGSKPVANPQIIDNMRRTIEGTMYVAFLDQIYINYPDSAIGVGGTWSTSNQSSMTQIGNAQTSTNYKITSIRLVKGRRLGTIEGTMTGSINLPAGQGGMQGRPEVKVELSRINGAIKAIVDLDNGVTVHSEATISTEMKLNMKAGPAPATKIEQKQELHYTVDLIP